MASSSPPFQTPSKRKRGQETPLTPPKFTFNLDNQETVEDGSNSPRTTVAYRFKGLDLQSGGGGVGLATSQAVDVADELLLKRQKPDQPMGDVSDAVYPASTAIASKEPSPKPVANTLVEGNEASEPESLESRKRAGTPPLKLKMYHPQDAHDSDSDDEDIHIVDPVRAALTWHEDEITVYDPDDKDDDGTGINGIGFRPTPAIAHARSLKRRQQITEYRKREESEARARRNQRRREGETPSGIGKASPRKVRFSDSELRNIAVTI
ncbi:hypothetical protein LMH87_005434 [Akanthomyces muscarius]|uniref:Uncharacterized protein n=1 Tax=Akanthomyces muscarius TaxID=2231603 RepID=A0A9W8QKR0_AKAMU|nr:hypothetical protein LMH87_005434 [Akanthomyces muscarius]KAJ4163726.1 hypothetical protein LMH87_005434 [Akanthomyces muscarius]